MEEVLSTAAVNWATPEIIESYSSWGPGTIYYPTVQTRQVPNITAVDGVSTTVSQYSPFYGTSAAAPHVAAIAALVWSTNLALTSADVRNYLKNTSVDLGTSGLDYKYGSGRVDAFNAVGAAPLSVTINQATGQADPTNSSTVNFTAVFSKSVTDFATGDVTLSGTASGETTAVVTGSGTTYNVAVSGMSSDGTIIANIAPGKANDAANTVNTASTSTDNTVTYDTVGPSVTLASTAPNPTKTSPFVVTATFSEAVTNFLMGEIAVVNGSAGSLAGGPSIYTFNVTPGGQGEVIVSIGENVAQDAAGNGNVASSPLSRTYDSVAPTVTLTSTAPNPTKTSSFGVTATFSEAVTNFWVGEIAVVNGSAGSLAGGPSIYTFNVTPGGQGEVTVSIGENVAQDAAGNGNVAASPLSRTYDSVAPTVTLTSTAPNPTKTSPIPFTATFNEAVTDFVVGDITVSNGTIGNFIAVSGTVYTFNVTPTGEGVVTVNIASGVAQDAAGNGNVAASPLSRTYDSVAPTVTLTSTAPNPTKTSPFVVTATFSEAVMNFWVGEIAVVNGSTGSLAGGPSIYTFSVTPSGQGEVTVSIGENVAHDAAGNGNVAASPLSRTYDTVAPTVTLTSTASDPTKTSPIPLTATFSETVTDFVGGDITASNGTTGTFVAVSGTVYTFDVTPTGEGVVTVNIASSVAQDAAGMGMWLHRHLAGLMIV